MPVFRLYMFDMHAVSFQQELLDGESRHARSVLAQLLCYKAYIKFAIRVLPTASYCKQMQNVPDWPICDSKSQHYCQKQS